MLDDIGEHCVDRRFELGQARFRLGRSVDAQTRVVDGGAVIARARIHRDPLVDHQRLIETAVRTAPENMGEHVERLALARPRGRARGNEIIPAHAGLGDARILQRDRSCRLLHRLLWTKPRLDIGDLGNLAVSLLRQRANLFRVHVSGDDDNGVVGCVEAPVELQRTLAVELLDFVPPADDRPAVGMVEVERRIHLLAEPRAGIIADPHVLLFQHDIELGPHHVVGEHQSGHSVGFEFHHALELVARYALEIAGIVGRRKRVLLSADGGNDLGEAAGRILLRALEHQMFEEMGEARLARRLIGGADLVPDHVGHDRRAMIGNDHDLEPVR